MDEDAARAAGAPAEIERNAAAFLIALARATGAEVREDAGLEWAIGGSPIDYHNCVVRAELGEAAAERAIGESVERFRARGVPGSWHVGPSMRPADLPRRLLAHGFVHDGDEAGMALDLARWEAPPAGPGLAVELVRTEAELARWAEVLGQGFGAGPHEARWVAQAYRALGLDPAGPARHYLALLRGAPVGTGTLFLTPASAGLYFVFTVPGARRRGVGTELTAALLREAQRRGARLAVLSASAMGRPVYARLGFRDCCAIRIWVWRAE